MSKPVVKGTALPLVQVMKELARDWRSEFKSRKGPTTADGMTKYFALPIFTLTSLIAENTGLPEEQLKHVAWHSDTEPEYTPAMVDGRFQAPAPDPELEGIPDVYLTGRELEHLRSIYNRLNKCDTDGRTKIILASLDAKHPGTLDAIADSNQIGAKLGNGSNRKRRRGRNKERALTAKQSEAVHIVGEHKGDFTAAAKVLGVSRQALAKRYKIAYEKLGKKAMPRHKTTAIPTDRRRQENISDRADRR